MSPLRSFRAAELLASPADLPDEPGPERSEGGFTATH
jgi:hypothetical protein